MPRHRRPPPVNAAGQLPASRLPLGSPVLSRTTSPPQPLPVTPPPPSKSKKRSREPSPTSPGLYSPGPVKIVSVNNTPGFIRSAGAPKLPHLNTFERFDYITKHRLWGSHPETLKLREKQRSQQESSMTSNHSEGHPPLSIAEAKLERQNKRIETANAALTSHAPAEKSKQRKPKAWKPFDFNSEAQSSGEAHGTGLASVESRVNVFRAPSQGMPLSRPVSRISSHTQQSTASESERRDASFLEADDFQLFTGRRKSRPGAVTSEDKPSTQYATVEATFNKRAITEVFGNELPGPAFMDSTPGTTNGQLQFIQHPNGDVSAHQWSSSRFGWENIGQFSNIRKKIEGQLAAFRLKGETASQAVQQNTLAYFRAVAKQREADVMGLPFGAKEIAACLPDTRPPSTAPTGPRRVTSKVEMPERPSTMMSREDSHNPRSVFGTNANAAAMPSSSSSDHLQPIQNPTSQANPRFNPALNFTPKPKEHQQEDPFISAAPFHDFYGVGNFYDHHMPSFQGSYYPQWAPSMHYSYGPSNSMHNSGYFGNTYGQPVSNFSTDQSNLVDEIAKLRLNQSSTHVLSQQNLPPAQIVTPQPNIPVARSMSPQEVIQPVVQSKPASPLETRTAMREHVIKMGEQAKERTKSQANIRTVLYDPFQDHSQKTHVQESEEPVQVTTKLPGIDKLPIQPPIAPPPASLKHTQSSFGLPSLSLSVAPGLNGLGGKGQSGFPMTLAPSVRIPFSTTLATPDDILLESSPDRKRNFQRAPGGSDSKPFLSMLGLSSPSTSSPLNIWDPDELDDWYWGGQKFSRQTDFNNSIMTSDETPQRRKKPSTLKPIAPPSRQNPQPDTTPQTNFLTTRHLIPVLENLASYVQGSPDKRHDYFCKWVKAPEWAIDRGPNGNNSFFDDQWGQPPARIGRDPRYQPMPRGMDVRFGAFGDSGLGQNVATPGTDRRFGFGGRF